MSHLFSEEGQGALAAIMRRSPLLVFDFDGTLAPIVTDPADARIPEHLLPLLTRLARYHEVSIVTGREVEDVTHLLGFTPRYIIGNHGAQDPSGFLPESDISLLKSARDLLTAHATELQQAGINIEDKHHSLALHFRSARDHAEALLRIEAVLRELDPRLKSFGGKCVVNIVIADAPDKGDAILSLVQRSKADCAVYVGDDVTDETVFMRTPSDWLTVRIGHDSSSHASYHLDDQTEMLALLRLLVKLLPLPARE